MYTWASGPVLEVKYKVASPCDPVDLLQTLLEPMLLQRAASTGFATRFSTEYIAFQDADEPGYVHVCVKDLIFEKMHRIRCRYLFGADGARSKMVRQLELPIQQKPGGGLAWNILVKADLGHLMLHRKGNLY